MNLKIQEILENIYSLSYFFENYLAYEKLMKEIYEKVHQNLHVYNVCNLWEEFFYIPQFFLLTFLDFQQNGEKEK